MILLFNIGSLIMSDEKLSKHADKTPIPNSVSPEERSLLQDIWFAVADNDDTGLAKLLSENKSVNLNLQFQDTHTLEEMEEYNKGFSECAKDTLLSFALRYRLPEVIAVLLEAGADRDNIPSSLYKEAQERSIFYGYSVPKVVSQFFAPPSPTTTGIPEPNPENNQESTLTPGSSN